MALISEYPSCSREGGLTKLSCCVNLTERVQVADQAVGAIDGPEVVFAEYPSCLVEGALM